MEVATGPVFSGFFMMMFVFAKLIERLADIALHIYYCILAA